MSEFKIINNQDQVIVDGAESGIVFEINKGRIIPKEKDTRSKPVLVARDDSPTLFRYDGEIESLLADWKNITSRDVEDLEEKKMLSSYTESMKPYFEKRKKRRVF